MQITNDRSRALWRRQVILTALVAVAFGGVALLSSKVANAYDEAVARRRLRLAELDTTWLTVALIVAVVVTTALLIAACIHAIRIARLLVARDADIPSMTFSRGDNQ